MPTSIICQAAPAWKGSPARKHMGTKKPSTFPPSLGTGGSAGTGGAGGGGLYGGGGGGDNSADASGFGVGGGGGGSNLVPPGGTSALRTDPAQLTIS